MSNTQLLIMFSAQSVFFALLVAFTVVMYGFTRADIRETNQRIAELGAELRGEIRETNQRIDTLVNDVGVLKSGAGIETAAAEREPAGAASG